MEEIKSSHELEPPRVNILDRVLSPERLEMLKTKGSILEGSQHGTSARIFVSQEELTDEEVSKMEKILGRKVSKKILIKEAKKWGKDQLPTEALKNSAEIAAHPLIESYSVATSRVYTDRESGQMAMLEEFAEGINPLKKEDREKLSIDDRRRILFQMCVIGRTFHELGYSCADFAKEFRYDKQSKRIIIWDTAAHNKLRVGDSIAYAQGVLLDEIQMFANIPLERDNPIFKSVWDQLWGGTGQKEIDDFDYYAYHVACLCIHERNIRSAYSKEGIDLGELIDEIYFDKFKKYTRSTVFSAGVNTEAINKYDFKSTDQQGKCLDRISPLP